MKFFDYLDVTFQVESKQNTLEGFKMSRDGKLKAVHFLIGAMRAFFKWAYVPLLVLDWCAVQLHVHPAPVPPAPEKPVVPPPHHPQPAGVKEIAIN